MSPHKIDQLLQFLAKQAQDESRFNSLCREQQAMGALELLIETVTRAGVEEYINSDFAYTHEAVGNGLRLIEAEEAFLLFDKVLQQLTEGAVEDALIYDLEDRLVFDDFDRMYEARWAYVQENYQLLKLAERPE